MIGQSSTPEPLCCVNCSESFVKIDETFGYDDVATVKNTSNFVRQFRVPLVWTQDEETEVTVFDALLTIFNLHPVMTITEVENNFNILYNNNNNLTICTGCAQVLTNLYKFYVQFNYLRQANSFLAQKIRDLDTLLKFNMSVPTVSQSDDDDVKPTLVELQKDNGPMKCDDNNFDDGLPASPNDDGNLSVPCMSPSAPTNGPWVNLVRLTPQDILTATITTTKRKRAPINFQVETVSDDNVKDEDNNDEDYKDNNEDDEFTDEQKPTLNIKSKSTKFKSSTRTSNDFCKKRQKVQRDIKLINSRKSVKCPICDKIYCGAKSLKVHHRIHTKEKPYGCQKCGVTFTQSGSYYGHLRRKHGPEDISKALEMVKVVKKSKKLAVVHEGPKRFHCDLCHRSFTRAYALKTHSRVHSKEKPYYCALCERSFSQKGALNIHEMKFHRPPKEAEEAETKKKKKCNKDQSKVSPFLCSICGLIFPFQSRLKSHMFFHGDVRNFKCRTCDMTFKSSSNRARHETVHQEIKSYLCSHCGKTFSRPQGLKIHMQSHTGEKPYKYKICGLAYGYNQTLRHHIAKCHGMEGTQLTGIAGKPPGPLNI